MLRLLASRLLKKGIAAAGKVGMRTKKDENLSGEPKETAISREIMPADGSNPAQRMNGEFGTSPLMTVRQVDSLSLADGRGKE
jgi:hypothetical protein